MPKVVEKQSVLGGRGNVVLYGSGTSSGQYFYRELIKGTKNYKTRRIDNVSTMDEAVNAAIEIAFTLNKEPDLSFVFDTTSPQGKQQRLTHKVTSRKPRKLLVSTAVEKYLKTEQTRCDAGLISSGYVRLKTNGLAKHLVEYLNTKLILYTNEIKTDTFKDYPVYRSATTPIVRKQELKWIKEFCLNYLVANKLMDSEILISKSFIPKIVIKQTDRMKNPAINPDDWKIIIKFVRDDWRHRPLSQDNKCGWFFRNMMWHYLLFAKNTGMSVEEILKMRWKQIEIVDEGRTDSKGVRQEWQVSYIRTIRSKTQKAREIPANQARELTRWKKWVEDYIAERGIRDPRSVFEPLTITRDTLVFGQPDFGFVSFSSKHVGEMWREIRRELADQLTGHRFSPHPYTLYSMRSTFIEDHLLKGTPVIEVAEMAGHSIIETQRSYARLNLRKKGRELSMPKLGDTMGNGEVVDLFTTTTTEDN